jgi:hypothetical protein
LMSFDSAIQRDFQDIGSRGSDLGMMMTRGGLHPVFHTHPLLHLSFCRHTSIRYRFCMSKEESTHRSFQVGFRSPRGGAAKTFAEGRQGRGTPCISALRVLVPERTAVIPGTVVLLENTTEVVE